jgi:hypothetical protein
MAPNARPGGSPKAPAGQPAGGQVTAEVNIDQGGATGASEAASPNVTSAGTGRPHGQPHYQDELRDEGPDHQQGDNTAPPAVWDTTPPHVPEDGGWDADNTAAWDPAPAWRQEDAGAHAGPGELWEEEPDWEGEIVVWEGQRSEVVPAPLAPTGWAGAPTYPPAYAPPYLPAQQSEGDDAVVAYVGPGSLPAPPGVYDREGGQRTRRQNGPWRELVIVTAVAVIVSALILAVTTAEKSNVGGLGSLFGSPSTTARVASPPSSSAAGAAKGSSSGRSAVPSGFRATSTTAPKHSTSTLSQHAASLAVTAGVAQSLVKSWLATNPGGYGIGPADVAGTVANEVYYAVQPATGTYWALAAFKPSAALLAQSSTQTGQEELAQFHDSVYAFSWQAGPVWTLLGEFSTGSCPDVWVPRAVLAAWGLCGL